MNQTGNVRDIECLQSKIIELERIIDENDKFENEKEKSYKKLKERIEMIEKGLMTFQTDDSKIRSSSKKRDIIALGNESLEKSNEKENITLANKTQLQKSNEEAEYRDKSMDSSDSGEPRSTPNSKSNVSQTKTHTNFQNPSSTSEEMSAKRVDSDANDRTIQTTMASEMSRLSKSPEKNDDYTDRHATTKPRVKLVEQTITKTYGDEHYWRYLALLEMNNEERNEMKAFEGAQTVLCLDISASMAEGNAWTDALTFVGDYLNGLEDIAGRYGFTDEHVALVTFGHETKIHQRFTNNYKSIRQIVENQPLGGPSPLYGGLMLSVGVAGSTKRIIKLINNVAIFCKIIIVSDGQITEIGQYEGPDVAAENLEETKAALIQCMEECKRNRLDLFYVQVGKESEESREFSDLMLAVVEGRRLDYKSGRQFSRRTYLTTKIQNSLGIMEFLLSPYGQSDSDEEFSEEDNRMIEEIKSDSQKNLSSSIDMTSNHKYQELKGSNYPPIGSRVRRGPDWKWNMQDSNGPGTVTGHVDGERVYVEWDEDGHHNIYRYGKPGYDVLIVDEPRKLKFAQEIAVGCVVQPGKDWKRSRRNSQNCRKGVVIKVDDSKATVRWDNGKRGDYTYRGLGKCEIEVCSSSFRAFASKGHVLGSGITATVHKKNKNVK